MNPLRIDFDVMPWESAPPGFHNMELSVPIAPRYMR